jgi:AcrR family transcriptional regulator
MPSARGERTPRHERILEAALHRFAELGYHGTRIEDIARDLGIAKGTIFLRFASKEGLFLEVYRKALASSLRYLDAPPEARKGGFFGVVRYWLENTRRLSLERSRPFRIIILGDYGVDLGLRREVARLLAASDPYGTRDFIRFGLERGELRTDTDPLLLASTVTWMIERFQDALWIEEIDPGLFAGAGSVPRRIDQFLELLRGAVGRA